VIGSLVALVAGGALLGVSVRKQTFMRFLGPTLRAQYKVQRRLPNLVKQSEDSFFNTSRVLMIICGALLLGVGVAGLIAVAR
jgi:hypothetical protein